jgi:hypothetical protein
VQILTSSELRALSAARDLIFIYVPMHIAVLYEASYPTACSDEGGSPQAGEAILP